MTDLTKHQSIKREKTLLVALLLSAPGPIVTGSAAIVSRSATQIADFIRRSAELVALFVSWWIFRQIHRRTEVDDTQRVRLERVANLIVVGAMVCSGLAMLVVGVFRLFVFEANGNVSMGLIIAVLGLLTNTWFWWRYHTLTGERYDPVIAAQQSLYRAKACVDLCVVTALLAVAIAPHHPATQYIDALGCILVSFYLLYNGAAMVRKQAVAPVRSHLGDDPPA